MADFEHLLSRPEGETLDFKQADYAITTPRGKGDLIKDVLAMANTPRETDAHIVMGVKRNRDGSNELIGLGCPLDDADIQAHLADRVEPRPKVLYEPVQYRDKVFAVLTLPADRNGPYAPRHDIPEGPRRGQILYRRGSRNEVAIGDDLRRIIAWHVGRVGPPSDVWGSRPWMEFLDTVDYLDPRRRYVLLLSPYGAPLPENAHQLGRVPWTAALDLDPDSDATGILAALKSTLAAHRSLHIAAKGDPMPQLDGLRATIWYFARGLRGRLDTLEEGHYSQWLKKYRQEVSRRIAHIARALSPQPVTCVVLSYSEALADHLRHCLETALSEFGDSVRFALVGQRPEPLTAIRESLGLEPLSIPLRELCAGLGVVLAERELDQPDLALPGPSGAPIAIPREKRSWIEEDFELVHLRVGEAPLAERESTDAFLRGAEITWYELSLRRDVDRELTEQVESQVRADLGHNRTVRINLYHLPGAGGTTVARRVVWNSHLHYPCLVMRRFARRETYQKLHYLASHIGQPLLILVDGARLGERDTDDLYAELKSQHLAVVLLQVFRRFERHRKTERSYFLDSELTPVEAERFYDAFSRARPSRRASLKSLLDSRDVKRRCAFYFGLETFGRDFRGLESYVGTRVIQLTEQLQRIAVYIGMAHRYGQRGLPCQSFAPLLGLPRNRPVNLAKAFPPGFLELLVEVEEADWRAAHQLIAEEMVERLLTPPGYDRRRWNQQLSRWAREFAHFCAGDGVTASDRALELVRRVFIYRDNVDVLGTERSGTKTFSQLLDDLPREARVDVLRAVVDLFPEEAHFWAHLGRYYHIEMRDYAAALHCSDRALALEPEDPLLHHMRGMTIRAQIYDDIEQGRPVPAIVDAATQAAESFQTARRLKPSDEHAYISEVQMLIRLLDRLGRDHPQGLLGYVAIPGTPPFLRDALDQAESLLDGLRRAREGERPSQYELDCQARLHYVYGQFERALQTWDNLLVRRDIYQPPIRRQIVWTHLRRRGTWDKLSVREVDRVVDLLQQNLDAEPNNERDLRLWIQAIRRSSYPMSIDGVIERVAYWKANAASLEATYYLYVLYAIKVIEGSAVSRGDAIRYIEESRQMSRFLVNRSRSFEWLGRVGSSYKMLLHQSSLGEWDEEKEFWERSDSLRRVQGRIARIDGPQAGQIEMEGGLTAFFVPARSGFLGVNTRVSLYAGFSYEGIRAWEVHEAS